jgi:hypothetical protein
VAIYWNIGAGVAIYWNIGAGVAIYWNKQLLKKM